MIVVSNTSPLVNLAVVGQLGLLGHLYGRVAIPQAVHNEIVAVGSVGTTALEASQWIETMRVANQTAVASLRMELDDGEAEAIALALELPADLILLDERKGRVIAQRLGVRFVGLLGVLIEAKHRGLIPAVGPTMDNLIKKAGFWIGQELYEHVLQVAGEWPVPS
jgi:predicted nucleic acid-binding protein